MYQNATDTYYYSHTAGICQAFFAYFFIQIYPLPHLSFCMPHPPHRAYVPGILLQPGFLLRGRRPTHPGGQLRRLQIGIYRGDEIMYFSFRGERKVPKESPRKERTRVLSLRILSPVRRCLFALRQKGLMRYDFTGCRMSATSAERRARGTDLFAGICEKFSLSSPRFGRFPRGRRSAVRAGYRVSSTFRAIRPLRHSDGEGVARRRWVA